MIGIGINVGDKLRIVDVNTNEAIIDATVKIHKDFEKKELPARLISFDNKYFMAVNNPKFRIEPSDTSEEILLSEDTLKKYSIWAWNRYQSNPTADFYREFTYEELDEEVEDLVHTLNKFEGIQTLISCCGHDKAALWVDCLFTKIEAIMTITNLIYTDNFRETLTLSTAPNLCSNDEGIILKLTTNFNNGIIGEKAYKIADDFCNCLIEILNEN